MHPPGLSSSSAAGRFSNNSLLVKNTFLEFVDETQASLSPMAAPHTSSLNRVHSDPGMYEKSLQFHQQGEESFDDGFEFEIDGLSDSEDFRPGMGGGFDMGGTAGKGLTRTVNSEDSTTAGSSAKPSLPTAAAAGADNANWQDLAALLRENARLALENQLLRERAVLIDDPLDLADVTSPDRSPLPTKRGTSNAAAAALAEAVADPNPVAAWAQLPQLMWMAGQQQQPQDFVNWTDGWNQLGAGMMMPGNNMGGGMMPNRMDMNQGNNNNNQQNQQQNRRQKGSNGNSNASGSANGNNNNSNTINTNHVASGNKTGGSSNANGKKQQAASARGGQASRNDAPVEPDGRTTLMLRNLPNNYNRDMLLAMLDSEGFSAVYDFVYLPIDFKTQACLGYAFVNVARPEDVPRFWATFNGYNKWVLPSKKVCAVTWSGPHQGRDAHVERYRNSPVMHSGLPDNCKPALFDNGRLIPFPPPSKAPRAPRMRNCGKNNPAAPRQQSAQQGRQQQSQGAASFQLAGM